MHDSAGTAAQSHPGHLGGLQAALGAHAEGVEIALRYVAGDEKTQNRLVEGVPGVDVNVLHGAEGFGALRQSLAASVVEPAQINKHRDDISVVIFAQPGHTPRGVEASGEG